MTVLERFLRYVQVDTSSEEDRECFPSTEKQKNLGRMLYEELKVFYISIILNSRFLGQTLRSPAQNLFLAQLTSQQMMP